MQTCCKNNPFLPIENNLFTVKIIITQLYLLWCISECVSSVRED